MTIALPPASTATAARWPRSLARVPDRLETLFDPHSVAVVGASANRQKWGYWLARGALAGRERRPVYLVNRRGAAVLGSRSRPAASGGRLSRAWKRALAPSWSSRPASPIPPACATSSN